MTWQQIRSYYPDRWIIMEALEAHSDGNRRIFDRLSILDTCADDADLFPQYRKLRTEFPEKEIIFFHASRENLEIEEERRAALRRPL